MDTEEALQVADKAADRNTPAADHPSIVNMVYALEILADRFRYWQEKAKAWEASSGRMARRAMDATAARDQAVREGRELNAELDRTQGEWADLMEFIRAALNLDVRALDDVADVAEVRKILGRALTDARLLARVRDEVNGRFVAGSVVTADTLNTAQSPVPDAGVTESLTVRLDANESVKVNSGGVYVAPVGTDPKDTGKWTFLGTTPRGGVFVEFRKRSVANLAVEVSMPPAVQLFPVSSPEPDKRVTVVECYRMARPMRFERVAVTLSGDSLWRNMDDSTSDAPLWLWEDVNSESVREVRP
jgi:hypothetical protein